MLHNSFVVPFNYFVRVSKRFFLDGGVPKNKSFFTNKPSSAFKLCRPGISNEPWTPRNPKAESPRGVKPEGLGVLRAAHMVLCALREKKIRDKESSDELIDCGSSVDRWFSFLKRPMTPLAFLDKFLIKSRLFGHRRSVVSFAPFPGNKARFSRWIPAQMAFLIDLLVW